MVVVVVVVVIVVVVADESAVRSRSGRAAADVAGARPIQFHDVTAPIRFEVLVGGRHDDPLMRFVFMIRCLLSIYTHPSHF